MPQALVGQVRPAVKGTLWTRIGLGLVHYGPVLGIEQFLIKRTLSRCFPRTHASTLVRKHTPVEGSCDNVCLIRNCSVSRLVHSVLLSKRIIINEFHRVPFTAGRYLNLFQTILIIGVLSNIMPQHHFHWIYA